MGTEQQTYFVNCRHCGRIIEVVCPRIGARVFEVKVITHCGDAVEIKCPDCKGENRVQWIYA